MALQPSSKTIFNLKDRKEFFKREKILAPLELEIEAKNTLVSLLILTARNNRNVLSAPSSNKVLTSTEIMESIGRLITKDLKATGKNLRRTLALSSSLALMLSLKRRLKLSGIFWKLRKVS